ncbi:gp53-like domain-containing protein, partial [Pectobacterium carotovorum]|uniref:gp53-like domain-containing protein n=1 Tax=Pectobacterium carotovorum TaxID=554 RepID=UPI000A65B0FB
AADVGAYTKAETDTRVATVTTAANNAATAATNANTNANGRVPSGRKVNGKELTADIALAAADVGAYTKAETDTRVATVTTAANNAATAATNANTNANGRVPSGRKVNGKELTADIALTAADVGAYTKAETDTRVATVTTAANNAATAATNANTNANGRVPSGRKVNGKELTADIALTAADVGAYTKAETDTRVATVTTAANNAATAATNANANANERVPSGRKVNGKGLTADINLSAGDVGALPAAGTAAAATKLATPRKINGVMFDGTADINFTPQSLGFGDAGLSDNGYQKFPSGLIIQWGVLNENETGIFPIPFLNKCFVLSATLKRNAAPWDGSVTSAYIISNSEFYAAVGQKTGDQIYWFAIGH